MSVLIVCSSKEHGNTRKLAEAMARELSATVAEPRAVDPSGLSAHGLIGFGSGIRFGRHYDELLELVARLPPQSGSSCFVFSTSGFGWTSWHRALRKRLVAKGFVVRGEFCCKALDTLGPLRLIGGLNKGRPNVDDLERARAFSRRLSSFAT